MPSPTLMIRPTSDVTSSALKSLSRDLITSVMSCEPMLNFSLSFFVWSLDQNLPSQLVEPRSDASVGEPIADLEDEAAEDCWIDPRFEPDIFAELGGEISRERSPVRLGEGDRGGHRRSYPARRGVGEDL